MKTDYSSHYPLIHGLRITNYISGPGAVEAANRIIPALLLETIAERECEWCNGIKVITRIKRQLEEICPRCKGFIEYHVEQWIHPQYEDDFQFIPERHCFWGLNYCPTCKEQRRTWDVIALGLNRPLVPVLVEKLGAGEFSETWKCKYPTQKENEEDRIDL